MNCEAYIAYYQAGEVQLYPNNIDTDFLSGIFASMPDEVGGHADFLAIQRRGDMVYYAFIAPLVGAGKDKVGLMVGLNNILITDILALDTFMRHTMRGLADKYRMARYEESLGGYLSPDTDAENFAANILAAQATLRDRFNERFNGCGTQPGPTDYSHSPQTDLRTLHPDGSLEPSSALSLTRSIESGNTLLVQIQHPEVKPQTEDIREPDPEPEDENESSQTDEAHERNEKKNGKKGIPGCVWTLTCLLIFLIGLGALLMYRNHSQSSVYQDSTSTSAPAPEAIDNVSSQEAETEKPDAAMPAPEVAEAAAAPEPDTQVSSDAAILAKGKELLYDIDNALALFNQGQTTEYQLIEKFTNLQRFIRSIGQSGFHTLAIDYDFLNLWSKINDELWDSAIRDLSAALNQEHEWFNNNFNDLNEIQFLYYDESS